MKAREERIAKAKAKENAKSNTRSGEKENVQTERNQMNGGNTDALEKKIEDLEKK